MFNKKDYEKISNALETSCEILYAIEQVTGESLLNDDSLQVARDSNDEIQESPAYALWEDGGRENEILAALPTKNGGSPILDGTEVFWVMDEKFAEFDGRKWIKA